MTLLTAARIVRRMGLGHSVRFFVGKLHVGTPDETVSAEWRARVAKAFARKGKQAPGLDALALGPEMLSDALALYAVALHRHNRRTYRRVMRGGF